VSAGLPGEQGPAGPTLGWYKQGDWAAEGDLPLTVGGTILQITLPYISESSACFGSATFELVNHGPVDATVNCNVGNTMGHELFVPVNQLSDSSQGGVWGSDISTFTLTGMSTFNEMRLECRIQNWQGQGQGQGPVPDVRIRRGSLEATYVSVLNSETLTP